MADSLALVVWTA